MECRKYALAQWQFDAEDKIDDGRYAHGPISDEQDKTYYAKLALQHPEKFGLV